MLNTRGCAIACFLIYIIQTITSDCPFPKKEQIPNGRYFYRAPEHANWKMAPENYPLRFRCSKGFFKRGAVTSFCRNGRWTRSIPKCIALHCTNPPEILNGNYTLGNDLKYPFTVGTTAVYTCDANEELENSSNAVLTCTLDWDSNTVFWNGTRPNCIAKQNKQITKNKALKCSDPPAILNGDYRLTSDSNERPTVGTTATYICDSEYDLDKSTDSVLTCALHSDTKETFWVGTTPACICKTE